jgi:hypothetical protein
MMLGKAAITLPVAHSTQRHTDKTMRKYYYEIINKKPASTPAVGISFCICKKPPGRLRLAKVRATLDDLDARMD